MLSVAIVAMALGACAPDSTDDLPAADLVIVGGSLHDGGTGELRQADIAITGDRIVWVGPDASSHYRAQRTIDATGKVVAPGFIDPHGHPNTYIRADDPVQRRNAPWLYQGVTTLGIGVDGGGSPDIAEQREWFLRHGVGTNLVPYVGFGAVRSRVLGQSARKPDAAELSRMRELVASAMCGGAFGLSTGLFYVPQSYAETDEVVAVATEAARRGGLYDSHQRDESSYGIGLIASTSEAIEIGRRAGMPVHIAHIKALGVDVHGKAAELIELIEKARADGLRVTADQYPWLASGTGLAAALLPAWSREGGRKRLLERLADPAQLADIQLEMTDNLRRRGGAEAILLTSLGEDWTGLTLEEVAADWGLSAEDAALRIIGQDERPPGVRSSASIASFNMRQDDVELLMQQPWVVTSSDGSNGHPRQYGSFPEKFARYVREKEVLDIGTFIHRSTGLTADILGLQQRGYLKPGYFADVVVFDPETLAARATYVEPRELSVGVSHLVVNGTLAISDGEQTDALAGRMLHHVPTIGTCP
ncbi:N-acyl-D-amino-acid deacylase family protein [Lysobacter sp. A286]